MLKQTRYLTFRAIENIWAICFGALGKIAHPRARYVEFVGGQNVCVIAPHPDDEVMGCGGALVLHQRAGGAVRVVYVTDGRKSRALGLNENEMATRRHDEADMVARYLGVETIWLGLPEGAWDSNTLENALAQCWRETMPDVLYLPSRVDFHPEHFRVAHTCARALAQLSYAPRVRVYAVQVPLTSRLCNRVTTVETARELLERAGESYATQRGSLARGWRMRHYAARWYGAGALAEEFWEMNAAQYIRLHESAPDTWNVRAFRSLRMAPFTDPPAYTFGRAERARLKRLADA